MRIALVCDYALDRIGDAQAVVLREAELLRAAGDDVVLIGGRSQRRGGPRWPQGDLLLSSPWRAPGIEMPVLRNGHALRRKIGPLLHDIDVLHVHSEFGLAAAAVRLARERRVPVVHTVHTFFWRGPDLGSFDEPAGSAVLGIARMVRGTGARTDAPGVRALDSAVHGITLSAALAADAVISPSVHQGDALRLAGIRDVAVVPNPMPATGTRGVPLRHVERPVRVLWVGRVTAESRLREFLRAVVHAGEELPPGSLEVTVLGDGPVLPEAREIASGAFRTRGSTVRFLSRVEPDEVARQMRDSHLVAVTSFGVDAQPIVVAEAFHAARSVLYVDPRLREGLAEAGILCGSPDSKGMSAMLKELVHHPGIIVERSARAADAAPRFEPDRHVRALREVWTAAAARA